MRYVPVASPSLQVRELFHYLFFFYFVFICNNIRKRMLKLILQGYTVFRPLIGFCRGLFSSYVLRVCGFCVTEIVILLVLLLGWNMKGLSVR